MNRITIIYAATQYLSKDLSNKHETLRQCWLTVGSSSTTLDQQSVNIGSMSRVFLVNSSPSHQFGVLAFGVVLVA